MNFASEAFISGGLTRLTPQRQKLAFNLAHNIFKAFEISLCGAQPQLAFVTPRVQAAYSGGFFQNAATIGGFSGDQLADLVLPNERW